jgi:hypothetical protein
VTASASIENVKPPLAFRQIQAAPLADWRGDREHAGFQQLLCTISKLVGSRTQRVGHRTPAQIRADQQPAMDQAA